MPCTICQHPKRQDHRPGFDQRLGHVWPLSARIMASAPPPCTATKPTCRPRSTGPKPQLQDHLRLGCLFQLSQALEMVMATAAGRPG